MEVQYSSPKLEKRCTNDAEMRKSYATVIAANIPKRVQQLILVENVKELFSLPGKWHSLEGDYKGCVAGTLSPNWRIIVRGINAEDVDYKWEHVEVVCVEEIDDYH